MRALIITTGSRGDIQPFIALARGLIRAGHEPLLAAPRRFAPLAHPHGVPFAALDDSVLELQGELAGKGTRAALTAAGKLKPLMRRWLDDLASLADTPTDIVVYAPKTLGAPSLAERMDVPSLPALTIPLFQPTTHFPVPIAAARLPRVLNRPSWRLAGAVEAPWRGLVSRWREDALGLAGSAPSLTERIAANGVLNAWSRHLLPAPTDWPAAARPLGFWPLAAEPDWRPPERLTQFLDQGEPPVYIGFGSAVGRHPEKLTGTVLEALRLTGRRVIIATGWGALKASTEDKDVLFVDAVPHDWLLPRTAMAVHHGGVGTVAAAMRAGIPQIIKPFIGDQPFWARRVHALGIAPPPLGRLTPERLAASIDRAAGLADEARALQALVKAENGITAAVAAIEQAAE
ncbi:glycosyltransferase [Glycomyces tenuis]|uniref:glycosyltransferase n=1 Tax=Glycomyces tenuis TaxID=58116 RepID=UPI0003FE2431|nr:glycosyltransferase [Glycomyces tenuis]